MLPAAPPYHPNAHYFVCFEGKYLLHCFGADIQLWVPDIRSIFFKLQCQRIFFIKNEKQKKQNKKQLSQTRK